jgi:Zn2+/Cd2+-exporting ATPase
MQQYILSKKNVITVISGLFIVLGFFSHFVLENVGLSEWSPAACGWVY